MQTPSLPFDAPTLRLLQRAEEVCAGRGARLTGLRSLVLGLVLSAPRPAGAYDLLDRLRGLHRGAAPATVYRALDFLLEHGLVHKVERLSAFVGCVHAAEDAHGSHLPGHDHMHVAQFLICTQCSRVTELNDPAIGAALVKAARRTGFVPAASTVEADGICADCAAA